MLKLVNKNKKKIQMMDLEEGDFAEVAYNDIEYIVYIYRPTHTSKLQAVSLTSKVLHWDNVKTNPIEVIRVLKAGDMLQVVE